MGGINLVEDDGSSCTNLGHFSRGAREGSTGAPPEVTQTVPGRGDGEPEHDRHHRQRHQADVQEAAKTFFPMPDYDLSDPQRVKVRIIGKVFDEKYTRILMARTDLDLMDVIALDRVQKRKPITEDEFGR